MHFFKNIHHPHPIRQKENKSQYFQYSNMINHNRTTQLPKGVNKKSTHVVGVPTRLGELNGASSASKKSSSSSELEYDVSGTTRDMPGPAMRTTLEQSDEIFGGLMTRDDAIAKDEERVTHPHGVPRGLPSDNEFPFGRRVSNAINWGSAVGRGRRTTCLLILS